ncbi:hypothetical protein GJAV_G00154980 [Gymnothorax javanicus]|nr:hypothetical protein GJAV_G00154980 [Gymnothorax javanicus]
MLAMTLLWVLFLSLGFGTSCVAINICFSNGTSFFCVGSKVHQMPAVIPKNISYIEIKLTQMRLIPREAFAGLHELSRIMLSENGALERIAAHTFSNLSNLAEITITKSKNLVIIHKDAFWNLPRLKYLTISNTGLKSLPSFSKINSAAKDFLVDLQDNMNMKVIPPNAFLGLSSDTIGEIRLTKSGITEVLSHAFNGTKVERLKLRGNLQLSRIHSQAFSGAEGPIVLDISRTSISALPENILWRLKRLTAESVPALRKLNLDLFTQLIEANLTYRSHCCAFANAKKNMSVVHELCNEPNIKLEEPQWHREHCITEISCHP